MRKLLILVCLVSSLCAVEWNSFSYTHWFMQTIKQRIKPGSVIVQLGSSWLSSELSREYTVYTVEYDQEWLGRYTTKYLYVPLQGEWYDLEMLKQKLPAHYDCIFVDGLCGYFRQGFLNAITLFHAVPIIIDGLYNSYDTQLVGLIARALKRKEEIIFVGNSPLLAYI